tara:strand:- start:354 stop:737 length:384 start_codon:yes stop_codon:yes gene_type:complete
MHLSYPHSDNWLADLAGSTSSRRLKRVNAVKLNMGCSRPSRGRTGTLILLYGRGQSTNAAAPHMRIMDYRAMWICDLVRIDLCRHCESRYPKGRKPLAGFRGGCRDLLLGESSRVGGDYLNRVNLNP